MSIFEANSSFVPPSPIFCSQEEATGEITFYMKGADAVMATIVQYSDWLEEEVQCKRVGLAIRCLVAG